MSDSRRLAQELYEIRALALSHATSPQLGVSSVDGEGLVLRDGDGNDLGRIGGGENGMEVEYLYGPKPPQPSAPDVSADTNLISVRWDGLWADQSETDPDIVGSPVLDRVEVHVSSDENFVPDQIESLAGTMPVLDSGGQILVGPLAEAGDWYVVLLARGKDGQYGVPSDRVHVVTTVGLMENELFGLALRAGEAMESADGKNSVYYGDEEPQPLPRLDEDGEPVLDDDGNPLFNEFTEGDIWFGEGNMPHVWSETDGWVSAADERVDAVQSVVDELESDLDAVRESADGKTSTFYKPTAPPVAEASEGDLWFDTSAEGGNTPHRFTDGAWVSVADQRVQAVQDAMGEFESDLDTVRDTANGKNRTFYQSTMPATPPARAGDLWFNTANGYRLHRNNGATFIEVADGRIADLESEVENIDISGPLSEARAEWLADAAADAQTKAQNAAATAEAAAKAYADAVATGAVEGELEGLQDYADNAAEQARQAAIQAAIAEARVIANGARDEALAAALDADAVISQSIAQFESDLDLVRESADGKSKITWSPNAPSGDGKAGDTWFRTSSNRIIGHWRHSGSSWVSMSLDAAVIPNLDAGKITSGFIDSERIAAGSIQAGKLLVGNFTNLVPDPAAQFEITDTWRRWGNESIGAAGAFWRYGATVNGNRGVRAGADEFFGSSRWLTSTPFQVRPGDRYFIQVTSYNEYLVGGSPRFGLRLGDESNGYLGETPVTIMSNSGWETYTAIVEIPDNPNIKQAALRYTIPSTATSGYAYFVDPVVRPAVGGVMIEDGAIVAEKISAGAVGATAIAAESIDASKIVAGGIQADSLIVPGTVGSTLIKDGAITTSKIEAGSITAQSGIIASLDAGVISSGFIDSARIRAASISADKILVGGAGNLLTNPGFVGGGAGWSLSSYNPQIATSGGPTGEPVLSLQSSGPTTGLFPYLGGLVQSAAGSFAPDLAAVEAGKRYSASVWVRADVDIPVGNAGMGFRLRELGSATLGWAFPAAVTNREVIPANTWAKVEGEVLVPTDTGTWNRLAFGLRANGALNGRRVEFSAPVLLPMVGATLIEPGAITTEKIATGAITAESGIIGSIDAGKITVGQLDGARIKANSVLASSVLINSSIGSTLIADGAITTGKIAVGAITAESGIVGSLDAGVITTGELRGELIRAGSIAASALAATAIDGKTITGATVRTAAAGARVEMNSTGLYVKNQFGTNTVSMQNGAISVEGGTITGGTVRTSASGARVQLDRTGLKAYNPDGDETFSISSNTGTVDMEGNLRQTNTYGRLDVGPTVFASGADGRGAPGIGFSRHSKPSGVANQAGMALREPSDGTGSFFQVQSEGGDAGWSFLNLATPGASAHTGLHRWFTGDDRSSFNINGDGNTYISTVNQAGKGNVWLQTYVRGRDHSQTRFSMQNSGRVFASTYVGSNPDARTSMLDMGSEGTWLIAGSGTSATSSRNLNLNAYGDAYMRAYGRGNDPALDAYVGVRQDGGAVVASAGGSEWIGVGYTGTSPGGDGIYVRTLGDLTMYMGRWAAPNINTGSGTDLIITASNYIGKKSSSRRYKIAEEPIEYTLPGVEDALLDMEVKTWFDRRSAERLAEAETEKANGVVPLDDLKDVDPLRRIPGVVAEDLDAAGLGMFVVYNEDGSPESVMYDRLGVALVPAVKALRDRVNELEDKIGELWNG